MYCSLLISSIGISLTIVIEMPVPRAGKVSRLILYLAHAISFNVHLPTLADLVTKAEE